MRIRCLLHYLAAFQVGHTPPDLKTCRSLKGNALLCVVHDFWLKKLQACFTLAESLPRTGMFPQAFCAMYARIHSTPVLLGGLWCLASENSLGPLFEKFSSLNFSVKFQNDVM